METLGRGPGGGLEATRRDVSAHKSPGVRTKTSSDPGPLETVRGIHAYREVENPHAPPPPCAPTSFSLFVNTPLTLIHYPFFHKNSPHTLSVFKTSFYLNAFETL